MSNWIDIKDRRPEKIEGERILGFRGYITEHECRLCDGVLQWCSIGGMGFTHWMPAPEYPEQ